MIVPGIAVIFAISVDTGEILDYEVKSLFCHECKAHSKMNKESEEYKQWQNTHELNCEINHESSLEELKAAAAVQIFKRSIETRDLKYTTFVGDSDSSSSGRVTEAQEKEFGTSYQIVRGVCRVCAKEAWDCFTEV